MAIAIAQTYKTSGTACWAVQGPRERIEKTEGPQQCGGSCDACDLGLSHLEVAGQETNKQKMKQKGKQPKQTNQQIN